MYIFFIVDELVFTKDNEFFVNLSNLTEPQSADTTFSFCIYKIIGGYAMILYFTQNLVDA